MKKKVRTKIFKTKLELSNTKLFELDQIILIYKKSSRYLNIETKYFRAERKGTNLKLQGDEQMN